LKLSKTYRNFRNTIGLCPSDALYNLALEEMDNAVEKDSIQDRQGMGRRLDA
jgi:hypothetical protein